VFQINFLVKDLYLAKVLTALDGKVYDLKVVPVRADIATGKPGSVAERVRARIATWPTKGPRKNFTVMSIAHDLDVPRPTVRAAMLGMVKDGTLARTAVRGIYTRTKKEVQA
jgi:hypothetical protein